MTKNEKLKQLKECEISKIHLNPELFNFLIECQSLIKHYNLYVDEFLSEYRDEATLFHFENKFKKHVNLLIDNERYNENFQLYIDESISITESLINRYDRKFTKYSLTPYRFIANLKLSLSDENIDSCHFEKWIKAYVVRTKRIGISKSIAENELIKIFGLHDYRGKVKETFEDLYSTLHDEKYASNIFSSLSILYENSFKINFEKLFPRAGATNRILYQTLIHMAESIGSRTITYESYKNIALKCRGNVTHKTIKENLNKQANVGLIKIIVKNKVENEELKAKLKDLLKQNEITKDEYYLRLKRGIKREYLESIEIIENCSFVNLQKDIKTIFFKSELMNLKAIGKRGNEIFWIIYNSDKPKLSKKEIYQLFPNLKNKSDSVGRKLKQLVEYKFLRTFKEKSTTYFSANVNDFILNIDRAKILENEIAENNSKPFYDHEFEFHKNEFKDLIKVDKSLEDIHLEENLLKLVIENKEALILLRKAKRPLDCFEWERLLRKKYPELKDKYNDFIDKADILTIAGIVYLSANNNLILNIKLYNHLTKRKKNRTTRIPHQFLFDHFLEKQVWEYESDRNRREEFLRKQEIRYKMQNENLIDSINQEKLSEVNKALYTRELAPNEYERLL
ncbi:hypothetical protein [Leptospira levettii]|uniref:hypothetical protein n=1 Tax=Leptospira levettii TaxID=2023178 RepID=UPI000C2AA233|nr:hypothetical protein [Leptospira levettii]PJZ89057.1 hypothetical protein CH368_08510 [Leptospira levettii]